jgi:hypothetical protein
LARCCCRWHFCSPRTRKLRWEWVSEGLPWAAHMVITTTIHMLALPTDITAPTGFITGCSSAPARGMAGVGRGVGAAGAGVVEAGATAMAAAMATAEVSATVMATALRDAASPGMDSQDVDSLAVMDLVVAGGSTEVEEDSMAEVVDSTVVAEAVTGNPV